MKIAPEGTVLVHRLDEIVPGARARVRMSDSSVIEPDCGHKARGVPGRWYCLSCQTKFEINDHASAIEHAEKEPEHEFAWQCFAGSCGVLVAVRAQ